MNIHDQLAGGTAHINQEIETLLDLPNDLARHQYDKKGLHALGDRIVSFAHGHHTIEDHHYFPIFAKLYPQFGNAMKLLDGDHRILETALNDTENAFLHVSKSGVSRDGLGAIYKNTKALGRILNRHFEDEEDVIIPIFLNDA